MLLKLRLLSAPGVNLPWLLFFTGYKYQLFLFESNKSSSSVPLTKVYKYAPLSMKALLFCEAVASIGIPTRPLGFFNLKVALKSSLFSKLSTSFRTSVPLDFAPAIFSNSI